MRVIEFGSVCSGIEAASVAWGPLGWRACWLSEIEPFPSAVLAHHYPETPNLGDMRQIAARVIAGEIAAPEVFTGGTPCQAFSLAGLRKSLDDDRGNLSLVFVRIADAIDHVRRTRGDPEAVIVWENVPGVLSTKDNAFGCFLAGLSGEDGELQPAGPRWADAGCVFGPSRAVAWRTLDAQYFGLAQRRRRVFVVASARNDFDPASVLFEWQGLRRDTAPSREAGESAAATLDARAEGGGFPGTDGACGGHVVPAAFGGNNTRGSIDVAIACNAHGGAKGRLDFESDTFVTHAFDARQSDAIQYGDKSGPLQTDGHLIGVRAFTQNSRSEVREIGGDGQIVGALAAEPGAQQQNYIAFSSKDHDADALKDLSPTLRAMNHDGSHANGGGQVAVAFQERDRDEGRSLEIGGDVAYCMTSPNGGGRAQERNVMDQAMRVRRLTPRECERLQGFEDDYTLIPVKVKRLAPEGSGACVKQVVTATVVAKNGVHFVATNHCMRPQDHCPRSGMPTGVGYELCRDICQQPAHAEVNAIRFAGKAAAGSTLYLQGHTYACEACSDAAKAAGVSRIIIGAPPGNAADGPRYKAIGNSWAVPCARWVGARIDVQLRKGS